MEFNAITLAFIVFSLVTLGGGIGVVTCINLFRGTIWLMVSLFGMAGLFILLSAPFLAAVQVLVYIGAIAILFTFAVMLTRSITHLPVRFTRLWANAFAAGAFFVLLVAGVIYPVWVVNDAVHFPVSDVTRTTADLGVALVSGNGFVLPFEVASLLLTAAMIGAIVIARDVDDEL
ncbi:MAG: NADH-quinone oxidoreductase subunit J [Anaerolineae bacterium]|jgi:NADH-quinone oxidoreductase subunit J|nr:NADH-quinone oxidoreductase subunit J [Anaerolineae bacterium]